MSDPKLPVRGDPDRMAMICEDVGTSATAQEDLVESYSHSETTIKNEIRSAIRLGFMEETEDGVVATDAGLDLASTYEGEERRQECFRKAVSRHSGYVLLVNKLFREPNLDVVERRDVEKHIRISLNDLSDDNRKRAATLFLDVIEASGIGDLKQAYKEKPARLRITNHDGLNQLLRLIDADGETPVSEEQDADEPTDGPDDSSVDMEQAEKKGGASPATWSTPHAGRVQSAATQSEADTGVSFNIELELDGTEDPNHIEQLVAAVQSGLSASGQSALQDTSGAPSDTGVRGDDSPTETVLDPEEVTGDQPATDQEPEENTAPEESPSESSDSTSEMGPPPMDNTEPTLAEQEPSDSVLEQVGEGESEDETDSNLGDFC